MTLQIPEIIQINTQWLNTTVTKQISKEIKDYFEDNEHHIWLQQEWYEHCKEFNPELYKNIGELHDNPPCLVSDLWYYEEKLGVPNGGEIHIASMVYSFQIEEKYPDWNNPKLKHLGQYWLNPYDINYHEKTSYTREELANYYKNYYKNKQDILDQINALPITQELQKALMNTLSSKSLWGKTLNTKHLVDEANKILQDLVYETWKNITLDTIQQPREIGETLKQYDENPYCISFP